MTHQPGHAPDLPQKAVDALLRGERQEAISYLEKERHVSREEARELVAAFILSQPGHSLRMKDTQSEARWGGLMGWLILLQAIVVAIGYFLFFHDKW